MKNHQALLHGKNLDRRLTIVVLRGDGELEGRRHDVGCLVCLEESKQMKILISPCQPLNATVKQATVAPDIKKGASHKWIALTQCHKSDEHQ